MALVNKMMRDASDTAGSKETFCVNRYQGSVVTKENPMAQSKLVDARSCMLACVLHEEENCEFASYSVSSGHPTCKLYRRGIEDAVVRVNNKDSDVFQLLKSCQNSKKKKISDISSMADMVTEEVVAWVDLVLVVEVQALVEVGECGLLGVYAKVARQCLDGVSSVSF
ncbi:unnamed protein product [Soboliphyme baturini]|uniref:Apple domain-containing protein n=1 Tax=Soboliphyme baturini TaxID=241478 RepID=A0A183IHX2_9BILA|nr:unnamed protein product [Soboliphyme baturini]